MSNKLVVTRRAFLRGSAVGAAVLVVGCGGDGGTTGGADANALPPDADPLAPDADPDRPDAWYTPECAETEDNIEGPFYKAGAPDREDLVPDGAPGVRLTVSGSVFVRDAAMMCVPLANALLDVWQCDDAAVYDQVGFNFRGKVYTAADGTYTFHSIIPGHYLNGAQYRPAHIHVKASGAGTILLTTQLYFEGDPYNDIDPFLHPSLIMPLTDDGAGGKLATFDFVLRSA